MEALPTSHCYLTYDEVITKAQTIQPHFAADLTQFSINDPWFTIAINTELLSDIYIGQKDLSESSLTSEINRLTNSLDAKLADARHCYEKLNYYVDKAFGENTIQKETFGYSDFERARCSAKKMIPLLNQALTAFSVEGNEPRLLEVGMPESLPLELATIVAELAALHDELKILKKQHLLITREQIDLFNSLWDTLSKICTHAKIIFEKDPQRLAIYELYNVEDMDADQIEQLEHE